MGNDDASFEIIGQVGLDAASAGIVQLPALAQAWNERQLLRVADDTPAWRHLCIVPLDNRREISGLLILTDKEHRDGSVGHFNEHDESLLRAFGHQAGAALHNARLHHNLEEAYEQLQIAQRQLAQMEQLRALGDLAAEVTHSMSHILGVIIGRADMFFNFGKDPQETVRTIMETAESGQSAIERIQQFTRLAVGKKRVEVRLHELLQESASDVQALWQQRHGEEASPPIEWQIKLPPLPATYANPTDLKEAINNLLLNALEAMPDGGTVDLSCRHREGDLFVEVGDTGTGMDDETRQQIFRPFFSTKEEWGNGLGLAIVYRIVVDHEGEITVDSTPGQGTRFTLSLPLRSEPPPPQEDDDVAVDSDH